MLFFKIMSFNMLCVFLLYFRSFFEIFNASIAGIHHFHSFKLSNAAIPASAPGRVLYIYIYIFMYMEHRSNLATRNVTFVVFCICVNM